MIVFGIASHLAGECCLILIPFLLKVAILTTTGTTTSLIIQDDSTRMIITVTLFPECDHSLVALITDVFVAFVPPIATTSIQKCLAKFIT